MQQILRLIYAEIIKIFKKRSTIIFLFILLILTLANVVLNKTNEVNTGDWKSTAEERFDKLTSIQKSNEEKLKSVSNETDLEVLKIDINATQEELDILEYALEKDIPVGIINAVQFTNDSIIIANLIVLLIMLIVIHSVQDEYMFGTVKQLFIQPVKRTHILCGKYISIILISVAMFLTYFIFSYLIGFIFFGDNNGADIALENVEGMVVERNLFITILAKYAAMLISSIVLSFILFLISSLLTKGMIPILAGLVLWLGSKTIYNLLSTIPGSEYSIFANIDLGQYIGYEKSMLTGNSLVVSLIVIIVHILLCICLLNLITKKKEIY